MSGVGGVNIENMNIDTAKKCLFDAIQEVEFRFNVSIQYDEKKLKATQLEINTTFPTRQPFCAYSRVIQLMKLEFGGKKGNFNHENMRSSNALVQDSTFGDRSTILTRIYDKGEEAGKDKAGTTFDKHLMRIEFVLRTEAMVLSDMNAALGKNHAKLAEPLLCEITDSMIAQIYNKRFEKIFTRIEKRLHEKMYEAHNGTDSDRTVVDVVKEAHDHSYTTEWIVGELFDYERTNNVPLLLDIEDIRETMRHIFWYNPHFADEYADDIIRAYKSHHSNMVSNNQRDLYNEIHTNGCGNKKFTVTMYR